MSQSRRGARRRRPERGAPRSRAIAAVAVLAVAAVTALILLGQGGGQPPASSVAAAGKIKGDPNAPVLVEEWGDFQ